MAKWPMLDEIEHTEVEGDIAEMIDDDVLGGT